MVKLTTAKELRNDMELALIRDDTTIGKPFETNDAKCHTPAHVNTYLIDCLKGYEMYGRIDEELWESFQEDFEGWTEELFALGHKTIRTTLRDFLRDNGVCVGGTKYISQQLFNVLQEDKYTEWPAEEVTKQVKTGRDFNSYQNPIFRAKMEGNNTEPQVKTLPQQIVQHSQQQMTTPEHVTTRTPHEGTPEFAPFNQAPPFPPTQDLKAKALTDLSKLYNSETLKFGGEMYDILDAKLKIFREMCRKADVQPYHYHEAFSTMLKGRAHQFYYDHLTERGFGFDEMIRRTRDFFHTTENHQLYLQEWRSTTFHNVITQNPDKDLSQNLELLIDKLQKVQKGLSVDYQGDYNLRDQLVNACQGVSACKMVLLKPSATFESVASDLRNAIGVEMRCQNQVPRQYFTGDSSGYSDEYGNDDNTNGQFWVDRRYEGGGGGRGRGFSRGRGDTRGNRGPRGGGYTGGGNRGLATGGYSGSRDKKCFVCGKVGCWSTKHPAWERKPRQDKWRQYAQEMGQGSSESDFAAFLVDFEGIDIGEWDNNDSTADFDAWCTTTEKDGEYATQQHTQYLTSYGTVDGSSTVAILNEQAALHGFTKSDMFSQDPLEPANQFHFRDRYSSETFQGIMPDTGAAGVSTAGENQFIALQKKDHAVTLDTSTAGEHRVRFGDNPDIVSLGTVGVGTPFGTVHFQVIPSNTPFLFCLGDMDKHNVYLNNVRDVLVHGDKEYPVVRKWGHPWLLIDEPERSIAWCHLTETELRQLHRRFGHPAADRLYKVLTRAGHEDIDKAIIAKLTKFCHQCQMHSNAPGRFKFTLRDDKEFNYQVLVDVMFIDGKPILHVIDAARFLRNMTAKEAWDALRLTWIDTYVGPPDTLVSDAGTNFTSAEFKANARIMAIEVEEVPVEAHNSIGKLERYHAPLRRAFHVIAGDLRGQGVSNESILQMAVKAVNDTAGPDGLVPTLLVFGTYPRLSDASPPSPSIAARAVAIRKAMAEVREVKAKQQISDALGMRNGPNTLETLDLPLQAEVKVWRENVGWKGPFVLLARDGETCTVDVNGKATKFRTVVVKPYHRDGSTETPAEAEAEDEGDDAEDARDAGWTPDEPQPVRKKRGRPLGSKNKPKAMGIDTAMMTGTVMTTAYLSAKEQADHELSLRLRKEGKITAAGAPFELSDKEEVDALIGRGVFAFEMFDPTKHGGTRIFKSRMVREVKGKATGTPYEKSRLVIQGHSDGGKDLVLTQSPTIQRASQRIIVAIAPSLAHRGMDLWLRDITQAYIQSTTVLQRTILAHLPAQIAHLYPKGTIMVVIKPLYGIAEAGTHWWATYFNHHREKLSMVTSTYDPCLLITSSSERFGIVGMQTDDTLMLCDTEFSQLEEDELNKAKFTAKPKEKLTADNPLLFNGCILTKEADGSMRLRQKKQGEKLKLVSKDPTVSGQQYVEQRARGAYIASICQPEAMFDLSAAAQHKDPGGDDIARLNKRLEWQMANLDRGLIYIPLDLHTAKLFIFVDGSFANNKDLTSQIGYEIFLANETTTEDTFTMTGNLVHWSSTKCKRVTRSVLASEIYAMIHGVDMGIATSTTLDMITAKLGIPGIPLIVCTDSFSLYECLVKLGTTKEKRLMIDIMSLRQSYERRELFEIRWIRWIHGQDNPADAMTKGDANRALQTFIDRNRITLRIQGRVKRDD
jgi:hypothetical protein